METGNRVATVRNVRDLCDLYGVNDPVERERLMKLARESGQRGWWESYDIYYKKYVGLEAEALSIRGYQSSVVSGLLQTVEYARALHEGSIPRLSEHLIQQAVEVRLRRQRLLTHEAPLRFWNVLDEAALHRVVGGPEVMRAQLDRLVEASLLPSVTVQVIPFSVGVHPGLENNFKILELPPPAPSIVYTEGLARSSYLDRTGDVEHFVEIFEQLTRVALSPAETIDLIRAVREPLT
jgi:hypothetical protein